MEVIVLPDAQWSLLIKLLGFMSCDSLGSHICLNFTMNSTTVDHCFNISFIQ